MLQVWIPHAGQHSSPRHERERRGSVRAHVPHTAHGGIQWLGLVLFIHMNLQMSFAIFIIFSVIFWSHPAWGTTNTRFTADHFETYVIGASAVQLICSALCSAAAHRGIFNDNEYLIREVTRRRWFNIWSCTWEFRSYVLTYSQVRV